MLQAKNMNRRSYLLTDEIKRLLPLPLTTALKGLFALAVFLVVSLWLSGTGTNAGAFDLARILVPDSARHLMWSDDSMEHDSAEELFGQNQADLVAALYGNSFSSVYQKTNIALLVPSVAKNIVPSISHLSDKITREQLDTLALDSRLLDSLQNQKLVANFYSNKYKVEQTKIEEYISNAVLIGKEVKIDPLLILAVMSIESNFNTHSKSPAGAEGLMQVNTLVHLDKYALYGGPSEAIRPEVNIRIGAYILKYLVATTGSLKKGLIHYVGAGNSGNDGGYADKVLVERQNLITLLQNTNSRANLVRPSQKGA